MVWLWFKWAITNRLFQRNNETAENDITNKITVNFIIPWNNFQSSLLFMAHFLDSPSFCNQCNSDEYKVYNKQKKPRFSFVGEITKIK